LSMPYRLHPMGLPLLKLGRYCLLQNLIITRLAGKQKLREGVFFPMNQRAEGPMIGTLLMVLRQSRVANVNATEALNDRAPPGRAFAALDRLGVPFARWTTLAILTSCGRRGRIAKHLRKYVRIPTKSPGHSDFKSPSVPT